MSYFCYSNTKLSNEYLLVCTNQDLLLTFINGLENVPRTPPDFIVLCIFVLHFTKHNICLYFLCLYFYILVIVYKQVRNYLPRNKFLYQKIRLAYWLIIIYAEKNCHRLYHQSYFVIFRVSFLAFFVADFNPSSSEFDNLCLHCDNESLCSDIISTQKKFM